MKSKSRFLAILAFVALAVLAVSIRVFLAKADCPGGSDIGLVVVVGEAPVPVQFSLASGIDCKLVYPGDVALWTSPLRTTAVAAGAVFTSGSGAVFGDANGDGQVRLDDLIFIRNRLGTADAASDLNNSGTVDENDLVLCRQALGSGLGKVTVYVEGLSPSASPCDIAIQLLTDPDEDGTFAEAAAAILTSASVSISPNAGTLGTPITISLTPAVAPLAFTGSTTAFWEGHYQPLIGSASPRFSISFSAGQVRETDAGTAVILAGDGTPRSLPAIELLTSDGTLVGSLVVNFGSTMVRKSFSFAPAGNSADFADLHYPYWPEDEGEPPSLGEILPGTKVLRLSWLADLTYVEHETLLSARDYHMACVCRIAKGPEASVSAPDTVKVNVVSFTSDRVELDRISNVVLHRAPGDPDPENILYFNDLTRPILAVDVALNKAGHPEVLLFQISPTGYTVITPAVD